MEHFGITGDYFGMAEIDLSPTTFVMDCAVEIVEETFPSLLITVEDTCLLDRTCAIDCDTVETFVVDIE